MTRAFALRCAAVFVATAVLDAVWAGYMSSVAAKSATSAALWAAALFAVSACVTRAFVSDWRMIVPGALGGAIGTWLMVEVLK